MVMRDLLHILLKYENYTRKGKLLMRKNHHHILCLQLLLLTDIYEVTRHKLTYACVSTHKRTLQTERGKWYGEGNAILHSTYYTLLPLSRNKLAFLYHCGLTKDLITFSAGRIKSEAIVRKQFSNINNMAFVFYCCFGCIFIWQF